MDVGSVRHTWTGASCARGTTRTGWVVFDDGESVSDGRSYIRRESEEVKRRRRDEEGGIHMAVIDSVSYTQ